MSSTDNFSNAKSAFIDWLKENQPDLMEGQWTPVIIDNVINMAFISHSEPTAIAEFISNIIPTVDIKDVKDNLLNNGWLLSGVELENAVKDKLAALFNDCYFEIYASYDDEISPEQIENICNSDYPYQTFEDTVENMYETEMDIYHDEIMNRVVDNIQSDPKFNDRIFYTEEVSDDLWELVTFDLPYEHFLNQSVDVDIFIDTGDANYDFTSNLRYPAYGGESEGEIPKEASIRWLAETQGYDEETLRNALAKGDMSDPNGFLDSMRVELASMPDYMASLVFLENMPLKDVIDINTKMKGEYKDGNFIYTAEDRPDCGVISLSKDSVVGLYDKWNGGGSLFEIQLEEDINLPVRYVFSALPDECTKQYTIEEVYGMSKSEWKEGIVTVTDLTEKEAAIKYENEITELNTEHVQPESMHEKLEQMKKKAEDQNKKLEGKATKNIEKEK